MRRDTAISDPDTVHIWVCQVTGTKSEIGARADRQLAQAWVERRLDCDGEWHGDPGRGKQIYKSESLESGSIEAVPLHDVAGLLIEEP